MIHEREYKDWSAKFHSDHKKKPLVIQMELTYRCPLHCVHCYTECYNNAEYAKKELSTKDVKKVMDKLRDAGCLWLAFTGGDPMARSDFLELYDYAKNKGFILSIMTSLAVLTDEILEQIIKKPPFSIDITLNGVTEETYDKISQVKDSFKKVMINIDRILESNLPLKIKTLVSKNNIHEINKIKAFVESRGLEFSPSSLIFARLNGDKVPCKYRLDITDVIKMDFPEEECMTDLQKIEPQPDRFFRCAIGGWQWHTDPCGNLNICSCVREPSCNLLDGEVARGIKVLSDYVKGKRFLTDAECKSCNIWHLCHSCPGKAGLEFGDEEKPIPYFCELAKREAEKLNSVVGS